MIQRKVYQPLLLPAKSSQLLSLTAISGIILRTQHGEQSTDEYLCDQSNDDNNNDQNNDNPPIQYETKFIYASQESVFQNDQPKTHNKHIQSAEINRIQLEYQKEILKLKTEQFDKINQNSGSSGNSNTKYKMFTEESTEKLSEVVKTREKVYEKRGKMRCSLELMFIHLNRSLNLVSQSNWRIIKLFFEIIKDKRRREKVAELLEGLFLWRCRVGFDKIKKQQKVKKISLKQVKVFEIEDILKKEMEKRNRKILFKINKNI